MHILHDSETEKDENISRSSQNLDAICDTEIAVDGTIWKKLEIGGSSGRPAIHKIFKDIADPTIANALQKQSFIIIRLSLE